MNKMEPTNELNKLLAENEKYPFTCLLYQQNNENKIISNVDKLRYARSLRECGKMSKSEEIFNQINLETIPNNYLYQYFNDFGFLYLEWGKFNQAKEYFFKSINLENSTTDAFLFLNEILTKEENITESIDILLEALKRQGNLDEVNYNLGCKYAMVDNYHLALTYLNECKKIDPNYPNVEEMIIDIEKCLQILSKKH
jgi:tetratricopeptide (TPR) repeat protein